MPTVKSVSFPIGADFPCLNSFPPRLEILECREVDISIQLPLLEEVAWAMPDLKALRVDFGMHGPLQLLSEEAITIEELAVRSIPT